MVTNSVVSLLRCPQSHEPLVVAGDCLSNRSETQRYRFSATGIPQFAPVPVSESSRRQQEHYDQVCRSYLDNLTYAHTQEYFAYLDRVLFDQVGAGSLGRVLEVCCGRGEALTLLRDRYEVGVGLDISLGMLEEGRARLADDRVALLQGDATSLPLADAAFDHVFTLGGIHHVNDRQRFFAEIFRVLKPGGRFIWREPVSDFFLWRALRAIIYRLSPALDAETEHPLRFHETAPVLESVGFRMDVWQTSGVVGFCLFMNSDVLVVNRLFRFLPGIRRVTRWSAALDHWLTARHWLRNMGLQVIGVARKGVPAVGESFARAA